MKNACNDNTPTWTSLSLAAALILNRLRTTQQMQDWPKQLEANPDQENQGNEKETCENQDRENVANGAQHFAQDVA